MTNPSGLQRAALIAGLFTLFLIIVGDMILIIATLALLSEVIDSPVLYLALRLISLVSLALPPYVAARAAESRPLRHALVIGAAELLLLLLLMTQTFSWQGTLHDSVLGRMPVVVAGILGLSLLAGWLAGYLNRREQRGQ